MNAPSPYWPKTLVVERKHCFACQLPTVHTTDCMVSLCYCLVVNAKTIETVKNRHWPTSKVQVEIEREANVTAEIFRHSSGKSVES